MLLGFLAVGGERFWEGEACGGGRVVVRGVVNFCWGGKIS